jgi:hypothetical protein
MSLEKFGISISATPQFITSQLTHSSLSVFLLLLSLFSISFPWTITFSIKLTHSAIGALTPRLRYWLIATQDKEDLTNHLFCLIQLPLSSINTRSAFAIHLPTLPGVFIFSPSLSGNHRSGHPIDIDYFNLPLPITGSTVFNSE